ncbi:MAG: complex I NDUFA9 subunit family protein [Alphaproteobacteria bacterium]
MDDVIVVFGGSGFIGKQVVRALAKSGKRVRVPMRRPHLGQELRVFGDVGQIQLVQANVRYPDSIDRALEDATGVVNLVGVMHNNGQQNFKTLHVEAAEAIAQAAAKHGVKRMVQISAIGAAPKGARYARTKFAGEQAVRAALPSATVLRPSIVFGPEDSFFNRFAAMARFASYVPLGGLPSIGGGKTKFQPIYVGDLAEAVRAALDRADAQGQTYEIGGPRVYTFKELLRYITVEADRRVPLYPIAFTIAQPIGLLTEWAFKLNPLMEAPLTSDQVTLLRRDNVVSADAKTIADLGITSLESVEAIVPTYLWRFRPYGQFQTKQTA